MTPENKKDLIFLTPEKEKDWIFLAPEHEKDWIGVDVCRSKGGNGSNGHREEHHLLSPKSDD